jgi:hypothetical protein
MGTDADEEIGVRNLPRMARMSADVSELSAAIRVIRGKLQFWVCHLWLQWLCLFKFSISQIGIVAGTVKGNSRGVWPGMSR